jgi:hypothetical protein
MHSQRPEIGLNPLHKRRIACRRDHRHIGRLPTDSASFGPKSASWVQLGTVDGVRPPDRHRRILISGPSVAAGY